MRARARMLGALAAPLLAAAAFATVGPEIIERFYRIDERVAVGAQPTPAQMAALADAGFRAVVNLRLESEFDAEPVALAARDAGLAYLPVPMSSTEPTDAAVEQFLRVTDDAAVYPVFIYCATANRATALWMVRRVLREGWAPADAEAEAERAGLKSAAMRDFARDYIRRHADNKAGDP
ncbi:MAG: protein tyrosine phosphatase family protein [Thermoanaerobaculia bacterium]